MDHLKFVKSMYLLYMQVVLGPMSANQIRKDMAIEIV